MSAGQTALWRSVAQIGVELFRRHPRQLSISLACLVVASFLEGIGLLSLAPMVELLIGADPANMTSVSRALGGFLAEMGLPLAPGVVACVFILSIVLKSAFSFVAGVYFSFTMSGVTRDLRMQLVSGLSCARWQYFSSLQTGRLANTISNEAQEAEVVAKQVLAVMSGVIQTAVYVVAAAAISIEFTVAAVVAGFLMIWALNGLVRMARDAGGSKVALLNDYLVRLVDWLSNMKPLKAMGLDSAGRRLLEAQTDELFRAQKRLVLANQAVTALQEPVMAAALAAMLIFSLEFLQISAASLAVTAVLFSRTVTRLGMVQNAVKGVAASEAAYYAIRRNIADVEAQDETAFVKTPQRKDASLTEGLRFCDVSFRYEEAPVIERLDVEFRRGALTALIGPSGAGKSTCLDLLAGLVAPTEGRVLMDGADLAEMDIRQWRSRIGYVPQEMALLHDTIRNNLTLGDPAIDDARIRAALEAAGAADFVYSSPQGVDALAGERGQKLSGGQRQRLAIARALVRKPEILLLDEATSALDAKTEQDICDRLVGMLPAVTIIATSHRPAMAAVADRVYRLEHGRIVDVDGGGPAMAMEGASG